MVLSIDFQMQKLVPYWGLTPQPRITYYLQMLNHDIFEFVIMVMVPQRYTFLTNRLVQNLENTLSLT